MIIVVTEVITTANNDAYAKHAKFSMNITVSDISKDNS